MFGALFLSAERIVWEVGFKKRELRVTEPGLQPTLFPHHHLALFSTMQMYVILYHRCFILEKFAGRGLGYTGKGGGVPFHSALDVVRKIHSRGRKRHGSFLEREASVGVAGVRNDRLLSIPPGT